MKGALKTIGTVILMVAACFLFAWGMVALVNWTSACHTQVQEVCLANGYIGYTRVSETGDYFCYDAPRYELPWLRLPERAIPLCGN